MSQKLSVIQSPYFVRNVLMGYNVSVQNLLNRDPPAQVTGVTGSDTILSLQPEIPKGIYGIVGRMFRIGVRFKM
jgi:hypothetical protein